MTPLGKRSNFWTYPWDILDIGLPAFTSELRERAGIGGVSVASSYHAGYFLQPRGMRKLYLPEDGTIYFRPDPKLWEGRAIKPKLADLIERRGDVLRDLVRARDAGGPSVSCWTVCLHNSRLGGLHPDATVENACGDHLPFSLCPSHPDARAYVVTLVRDLTANYAPDAVELEAAHFMGFAHGHHHEKDGVGLTSEDDLFLSLCFCRSCLGRARARGVDGESARRTVRMWIEETFTRATPASRWPDIRAAGPDVFRDFPEVDAYVRWRSESVTSLVAEIRDAADPRSKVHLITWAHAWRLGLDLKAATRACDGVVFCAYDMAPAATQAQLAAARAEIGPDRYLSAGLKVFAPEIRSGNELTQRVAAAVAGGADAVNFYNYGLIPAARLDWVRDSV